MVVRELQSTPSLRQCVIDDVHVMFFHGPVDVAGLMLPSPLRRQREFASDILGGAQILAKRSNRDDAWARGLAQAIEAWSTTSA